METAQIYELFQDFLDSLFFPGYTVQLAEENPEKFQFELTQFKIIYNI